MSVVNMNTSSTGLTAVKSKFIMQNTKGMKEQGRF